MIRFAKAALAGVKAEYTYGGGWRSMLGDIPWTSGSFGSASGKAVDAKSAMALSAVWACVRRSAEMISTLPVDHYRKGANDSRERMDDSLAEIIKESPNREQTAPEFWEGVIAQTLLQGNGCSEKLYVGDRLVGLVPLPNAKPQRHSSGELRYAINDRGKQEFLPADKVFHVRGFGAGDGMGMSTVKYGANSIGAALSADETSGSIFANLGMLSGIIQSDQTLNATQREQLATMLETYTGSKKAGKLMTLEAGLKYQQLQMNPEDAQLIETRRYSVEDICRWFGVPPIVIGHASEGQTMWGSGVEAILLSWLTLGVNPFLIRLEKRMRKDLIPLKKRRGQYFEYNREAMIQMDSKAKGDLMLKLGMGGTVTANERRAKLNLPRHEDPNADALLAQMALAPLETLGKETS